MKSSRYSPAPATTARRGGGTTANRLISLHWQAVTPSASPPHRFEVFHTPGHTVDGIVLDNRENRRLISSDTLWIRDLAAHTVRVEGSTAAYTTT
jgi:glyoxylase-like metal-dependent hydrolase (beta-lactamase superfamily II)